MNLAGLFFGLAQTKQTQAERRRAEREARAKRLRLENLETRDLMATLQWDGNGGNGSNRIWSAWNNWNPAVVPASGDSLVFAGQNKLNNSNDIGGLSIQNVVIQANGFNIDGANINLGSGGLHFVAGSSSTWSIPLGITTAETPIEVFGSRTLSITDSIYGSGGIGKYGVGVVVLSSPTSFTGATKIYSGTIYLAHSGALQGSTLDYNNYGGAISFGSLTAATFGGLTGSQNLALTNDNNGAVALSIGANNQFATYTGVLSGSGGITKVGRSHFTLPGVHTFTGNTTVTGGLLILNGELAASTAVVTAGTLTGNGRASSLLLNGGVMSPGHGVGVFTVANGANLGKGAFGFELNDGITTDQFIVENGDVTLGANLIVSAAAGMNADIDEVFALVNNTGDGALQGIFRDRPDNSVVRVGNQQFVIRYNYDFDDDGNANDVVLIRTTGRPTAVDDAYTIAEDGTLTANANGVLANDDNPEGESLVASLIDLPEHGTVTFSPDGKFIYKPSANYFGPDSMTYEFTDSQGGVHRAEVKLTVTPVNDAPVVGTNTFKTVSGVVLNGNLRATDVDGPSLKYTLVAGPSSGRVSMSADGRFTYTPSASGQFTFRFSVTDGLTTTQGTATLNVQFWNGQGIRPDVLEWIFANNPGLPQNFLQTEPPDRSINLPGGQTVQIYRLDQFLNQNFNIDLKSRRMEKVNYVERRENVMRKLMALPEFYHFILNYRGQYKIGGRGTVSALQAYNYLRNINKNVWVTATGTVNAPVGGGNGINAPSWAVWDQMNLLFHEMCHVINIGHNSGGLSGPLADKMRDWERQGRQNYSTINLNNLTIWQ